MSSADALQAGRPPVSSCEPGANMTLIFWTSFGLPPASPGSLQVARASKPEGVPGACAAEPPTKVETNCGLARAAVDATSPTAPTRKISLGVGTKATLLLFPAAAN